MGESVALCGREVAEVAKVSEVPEVKSRSKSNVPTLATTA
jgi:hypothetical protein